MTPADIVTEARRRGIVLTFANDRLHYRAPKGSMTPDLYGGLVAYKAEIVAAIEAGNDPAVAAALEVFAGATIMSHNTPRDLPLPRGWPVNSERRVDPYAESAPGGPCPTCRETAWWRQSRAAWVCGICHTDPNRVEGRLGPFVTRGAAGRRSPGGTGSD